MFPATIASMSFLFTELFILFVVLILLLILSAVWPPDSPWAPWWQMPDDVIKKMCEMVKLSKKDVIYDLGCGTGKAIIFASQHYGAKAVGIEIDPIRFLIAKWNVARTKRSVIPARPFEEGNSLVGKVEIQSHRHSERSEESHSGSRVEPGMTSITLLKKNFFDVNLSSATVIFVYLVPAALKRLTQKFLKELKPGTKFLSYVYPMPKELFKSKLQLIEHDTKMRIYYYKLI